MIHLGLIILLSRPWTQISLERLRLKEKKEEQTMMFQGILDLHVAVKSHKAKSESRWEVS
jgi:hypothetical protein